MTAAATTQYAPSMQKTIGAHSEPSDRNFPVETKIFCGRNACLNMYEVFDFNDRQLPLALKPASKELNKKTLQTQIGPEDKKKEGSSDWRSVKSSIITVKGDLIIHLETCSNDVDSEQQGYWERKWHYGVAS
ncbi:hypothetical protein BKA67DRAFT_649759 [Truncatella angustata]|uniref:Uncharacterized protein n=1 Tax=Truncatella angustata TaxID=152316 RepID=A0A9P8UDV7_9PEZI|nr:uncharacterized protein BKA67DRAFT_649759 [Truncatella angustata]KAH6648128.1 hypothetical protein BKA67DRAFT_649759 [Truncatella angustata]